MRASSTLQGDCDTGSSGVWSNDVYNPRRLAFFDKWLKDYQIEIDKEKSVSVFVMGTGKGGLTKSGNLNHGGEWRYSDNWPISKTIEKKLFLTKEGLLQDKKEKNNSTKLSYIYNPNNPVPTIGGPIVGMFEILKPNEGGPNLDVIPNYLDQWAFMKNYIREILPAGGFHQEETSKDFSSRRPFQLLEDRDDVLSFETLSFETKVNVVGVIKIELYVSSEAFDTDFTVKVIDVYPPFDQYPRGYHLNLTDTIFRMRYRDGYHTEIMMKENKIYKININLWPISNVFKINHKIRIDISSSNFPRFDVNPNTGELIGKHTKMIKTRNTLWMTRDYPSNIQIPTLVK